MFASVAGSKNVCMRENEAETVMLVRWPLISISGQLSSSVLQLGRSVRSLVPVSCENGDPYLKLGPH
jgi:hypothetical protein